MPATPSHSPRPAPVFNAPQASSASLEKRWDALRQNADRIGALAHLGAEQEELESNRFPRLLRNADERTFAAAQRGVEDMELLVGVGLKALKEVQSRGQDTNAPALALWREFYRAREAVLAVLEPVPA